MVRTYNLYRSPTSDPGDAVPVSGAQGVTEAPSMQHIDTPGVGDHWYWVETEQNGVKSAWTGPDQVTVVDGGDTFLIMSDAELQSLPTVGDEWDEVVAASDGSSSTLNLLNQNSTTNPGWTLANALRYARVGGATYRNRVEDTCRALIGGEETGTESGNALLAVARQLSAYVIAADLIDLDPSITGTESGQTSKTWAGWLDEIRTKPVGSHGRWSDLRQLSRNSPNNWGYFGRQSLTSIDCYLEDTTRLEEDIRLFRGSIGDQTATGWPTNPWSGSGPNNRDDRFVRTSGSNMSPSYAYASPFDIDAVNGWHPVNPVNPPDGADWSGIIVCDMNRESSTVGNENLGPQDPMSLLPGLSTDETWPNYRIGYGYMNEALQGLFLTALLLNKTTGQDTWGMVDEGARRALTWLCDRGPDAADRYDEGRHVHYIADHFYSGSTFVSQMGGHHGEFGRGFGFTDWLYG